MNVDFTDKIKYDGESQTVRPVRPGKEVTMAFYRLVTDSCRELVPALKTRLHAEQAPLTMLLDGVSHTDDETLDRDRFLAAMKASRSAPKSACPSPDCYARLFSGEGDAFAVPLSSKLSGSYNSAPLGPTPQLDAPQLVESHQGEEDEELWIDNLPNIDEADEPDDDGWDDDYDDYNDEESAR